MHRLLGLHPALFGIGPQQHLTAVEPLEGERQLPIPHGGHLGHRLGPVGVAGVARHEDEITGGDVLVSPGQKMLHLDRLAVFVGPEEADVETVPRIFKVVGIATEEGDLPLRGKDQPDVGVTTEPIEVVAAAPKQRDDVTPQARCLE